MLVKVVCHMAEVVGTFHESRVAGMMKDLALAQNVVMSADRLQVVGDFTHVPKDQIGEELIRLKNACLEDGLDFISVRF